MTLTSTIGGKRRKGRPKTRWSTEVIKNIQDLGITNWEDRAINRQEWRRIVNQVMFAVNFRFPGALFSDKFKGIWCFVAE